MWDGCIDAVKIRYILKYATRDACKKAVWMQS